MKLNRETLGSGGGGHTMLICETLGSRVGGQE